MCSHSDAEKNTSYKAAPLLRICDDNLKTILLLYADASLGQAIRLRLVCKRFAKAVQSNHPPGITKEFCESISQRDKATISRLLTYPECLNLSDFIGGGRLFPLPTTDLRWWWHAPEFGERPGSFHYPVWWGCLFQHLMMQLHTTRENVVNTLEEARPYIRAWDPEEVYFSQAMRLANERFLMFVVTSHMNYTVFSPTFLQRFGDNRVLIETVARSKRRGVTTLKRLGMWDTLAVQAPEFLTWVMNDPRIASKSTIRIQFLTQVYDTLSKLFTDDPWGVIGANMISCWQGISHYEYVSAETLEEMHRVWVCTGGMKLVPKQCSPLVHIGSGYFYASNMMIWSSLSEYCCVVENLALQWAQDKGLIDLCMGPVLVRWNSDVVQRQRKWTFGSFSLLYASYHGGFFAPVDPYCINQGLAHMVTEWFQSPTAYMVLRRYFIQEYHRCTGVSNRERGGYPSSREQTLTLDLPLKDFFEIGLAKVPRNNETEGGGGCAAKRRRLEEKAERTDEEEGNTDDDRCPIDIPFATLRDYLRKQEASGNPLPAAWTGLCVAVYP